MTARQHGAMLANEPPSALAGSTMSEFTPTAQRIALLARPLVFTNGVFDLLHAGHVMCLQEARKLGASLAVGINSDASARRGNKGPGRPFNAQAHRCRVMAALRCVDAVFLFEQDQAAELMRLLRPEVYVKGSDYQVATLAEARLMASDRKSTRLNSSHSQISYAVFCLKKKILSFISGRLATKSNQIKQLIRNGRSASLQRTFKKSFTSFSHSTRNKTRDGLIRVRNIRALNGRFNFFFTDAATTEIYTLSLHDALPI